MSLLGVVLMLSMLDQPGTPPTPIVKAECKVVTDIPGMEINLQRVCARKVPSHEDRPMFLEIKLTGDHKRAVWEYTFNNTYEWRGMTVAGTKMATDAWEMAVEVHKILQWPNAFPSEVLIVGIRDRESRPVCAFSFVADQDAPTDARCVDTIE